MIKQRERTKKILLLWSFLHILVFSNSQNNINTVDLSVKFESCQVLNNMVKFSGNYLGCSIWALSEYKLMDLNGVEIRIERKWIKGSQHNLEHEVVFKKVPKAARYQLSYFVGRNEKIDTIELHQGSTFPTVLIACKEVQHLKENEELFMSPLSPQDTFSIRYSEYGCRYTKGIFMIVNEGTTYSIELKEQNKDIEKRFVKKELSAYDIKLIKAFIVDSSRKYAEKSCNGTGSTYVLESNGIKRIVNDKCGEWGGYFLLKEGVFKD